MPWKRSLPVIAFVGFVAVLATAEYYRREKVRNSTVRPEERRIMLRTIVYPN
jgi:hypothetical protein